jgi:tRNA (guanine-N7-)-methyltransferase
LTYKRFLDLYKEVLSPEGWVNLKTDDSGLFEYTLEELNRRNDITGLEYTDDLESSVMLKEHHGITTRYEKMFSDKCERIKFLKFKFLN